MRIHWRKRFSVILIVTLVLAVWFITMVANDTTRDLQIVAVTNGNVQQTVSALGKVQPRTYVDVGAQASGQLKRLLVQPGDHVVSGELLAEIDPQVQAAKVDSDRAERDRLTAALADMQAQATYATGELTRQKQLRAANATRADTYDQAVRDAASTAAQARAIRAQIVAADSALKSDIAQLGYTRIYAPISGTVVSVDVRQGQTINATYATPILMRIADLSTMTVWTQVSEADVGQLRPGMKLWFTTLGYGDRRWTGTLRQILPAPPKAPAGADPGASTVSPAAGSPAGNVVLYTALFDVPNADGLLRPEMSAQVFFVTAQAKNVATVPMTALTPTDTPGRYTAQVAAGRKIETRTVTIGAHDRFTAEIRSGLKLGERVVTGRKTGDGKPSLLAFRL